MGARHYDGVSLLQEAVGDQPGHGGVRQVAVEGLLDLRVAAARGIAHDHQIRWRRQMRGVEVLVHLETQLFQDRGGGRVQLAVRAVDMAASLVEQPGQSCHARAPDTDQVNVFASHSRRTPSFEAHFELTRL